jgi:hypothetical protein
MSFFMNRFRKLGFIDYHAGDELPVHSSLLNVVLQFSTAKSRCAVLKSPHELPWLALPYFFPTGEMIPDVWNPETILQRGIVGQSWAWAGGPAVSESCLHTERF